MKTYLASRNADKLRELQAIFGRAAIRPLAYRKYSEVVEDADSYAGNALLKARSLAATLLASGIEASALADDSGLEVESLGGRPGLHSARYGGPDLPWPERRATLLQELRGFPPHLRKARFVCVLALIEPGREPIVVTGDVRGFILETESGSGGFGYDPLFLHPPSGRSFASLTEKEKNAVSHRGRAADALLKVLQARE